MAKRGVRIVCTPTSPGPMGNETLSDLGRGAHPLGPEDGETPEVRMSPGLG